MPPGLPPVFLTWFTKSQRTWLSQFTDEYILAIKGRVSVAFIMGVTAQFLDTYPTRHTRKVDTMPQATRNATLRTRIRAYFAFIVVDTRADWDYEARRRLRARSQMLTSE
ncbi:hypothetical protein MD484_g5744, partial [Candolleomyces efflorescens]